jgi:hypothetical protein
LDVRIGAAAALVGVVLAEAQEGVVSAEAQDGVVLVAAQDEVVSAAAVDGVVLVAALEGVVSAEAVAVVGEAAEADRADQKAAVEERSSRSLLVMCSVTSALTTGRTRRSPAAIGLLM